MAAKKYKEFHEEHKGETCNAQTREKRQKGNANERQLQTPGVRPDTGRDQKS